MLNFKITVLSKTKLTKLKIELKVSMEGMTEDPEDSLR